jgi:hypothetical protein
VNGLPASARCALYPRMEQSEHVVTLREQFNVGVPVRDVRVDMSAHGGQCQGGRPDSLLRSRDGQRRGRCAAGQLDHEQAPRRVLADLPLPSEEPQRIRDRRANGPGTSGHGSGSIRA